MYLAERRVASLDDQYAVYDRFRGLVEDLLAALSALTEHDFAKAGVSRLFRALIRSGESIGRDEVIGRVLAVARRSRQWQGRRGSDAHVRAGQQPLLFISRGYPEDPSFAGWDLRHNLTEDGGRERPVRLRCAWGCPRRSEDAMSAALQKSVAKYPHQSSAPEFRLLQRRVR